MKSFSIDNGLIVDPSTDPPTCYGYLFDFSGKGIFSPNGKVQVTKEEAETHNLLLAEAEWSGMLKHGRGTIYLSKDADGRYHASDWPGIHKIPVYGIRKSFHNMAGKNGRTDVWFKIDGEEWHGVNIGDNQILRVKKLKKRGAA